MRLSADPSAPVAGGGTPIYGAFRVDITDSPLGSLTGDWEYSVVGYTTPFLLLANFNPQTAYDPRMDFRDYAEKLSKDKSISDCLKLALMIYKAGQAFGGNNPAGDGGRDIINGLMSGLTEYTRVALGGREGPSDSNYRVGVFTRDPHYGGGFGDSGFASHMQDGSNQVRHFIFYLGAGWGVGSTLANQGLYRAEGTRDPRNPDVGLGQIGTDLGTHFNGNYKQLAQDVWHRVCGQSGTLNLP
jgi:hypothetical protein